MLRQFFGASLSDILEDFREGCVGKNNNLETK